MPALLPARPILPPPLAAACSQGYSGQVVVLSGDQRKGMLVLHQGRVAWAIHQAQQENLGTFLRRLGRVTRQQLQTVQVQYSQHGGKKKIGELLEEAGIIRRPVLRRCLLLHTRSALQGLLREPQLRIEQHPVALTVDAEMTFSMEELMPDAITRKESDRLDQSPTRWTAKNRLLGGLRDLSGYRASAVISADGEAVCAHSTASGFEPTVFGVYLAAVLEASSRAVVSTQLGQVDFALLDCSAGALVARWIDEHRDHLVVVLVGEEGRLGAVKHRINAVLPDLVAALSEHSRGAQRES